MRALVTTLGVVLTLGMPLGGLPAESAAAQATLGCPATVQAGQQLGIEIAINVGTTPLGAYEIAVTYDPAVLTVASVAGGSTAQFSGNPTTNTPTPGTTNLSAFQSASLTSPTGVVSVAMITFNVAATARPATTTTRPPTTAAQPPTTTTPPPTTTSSTISTTTTSTTTTSTTTMTQGPTTTTFAATSTTTTRPTTTSTTTTTTRPTTI